MKKELNYLCAACNEPQLPKDLTKSRPVRTLLNYINLSISTFYSFRIDRTRPYFQNIRLGVQLTMRADKYLDDGRRSTYAINYDF